MFPTVNTINYKFTSSIEIRQQIIIYSAFKFNGFLIIYCGGSVYKKLGFSIRLPSHIIIEMIAGLYLLVINFQRLSKKRVFNNSVSIYFLLSFSIHC